MKLRSYSVRSGVLISGFKVPRPPIFTEIPGGMYTHVSTLNMKIHENSDFLPVFMVNGGQNWGLWKYVMVKLTTFNQTNEMGVTFD